MADGMAKWYLPDADGVSAPHPVTGAVWRNTCWHIGDGYLATPAVQDAVKKLQEIRATRQSTDRTDG